MKMKDYLKRAAKAWASAILNVKKFADSYVEAVFEYGAPAVDAFKSAYPMFGEREWTRLTLIGNGELLPQFFFKSDFFVNKLLNLNGSMRFQKALVGASNDGRIRVDRGNGPEKVSLSDLTKGEEKALAMLMSEENEKLSNPELCTKYKMLISKINKSNRRHRLAWVIRTVNGKTVAHFNRACNMDKGDLEFVLRCVKSNDNGTLAAEGRPSSEIMRELVVAVCELESLRDKEWDFETENGPNREFWPAEAYDAHDELIGEIQLARNKVQRLCREATGNDKLEV